MSRPKKGESAEDTTTVKGKKRKKKNSNKSEPPSSDVSEKKRKLDSVVSPEETTENEPSKKKKRKKKKSLKKQVRQSDVIDANDPIDSVALEIDDMDKGLSHFQNNSESENNKKKPKKKKKKKTSQIKAKIENDESKTDTSEPPVAPSTADLDMSQWKNLFVPDELLTSLQEQGFVNPTKIQVETLPSAIRDRRDILGAAETGSGKTLAFGIPVLAKILVLQNKMKEENENQVDDAEIENDKIENDEAVMENDDAEMESDDDDAETEKVNAEIESFDDFAQPKKPKASGGPMALILEPTRELAFQVQKHLTRLAKHTKIRFVTVVGGMSVEKQYRVLKRKPEVIIATPGRLWQLMDEGEAHLSQIDCVHSLVVDEADRMIEKGHYEELTKILHFINESPRRIKKRQTFVMSATLSVEIGLPNRIRNKIKKKKTPDDSKLKSLTETICTGAKPKVIDLTTKDILAHNLTELRVNCTSDEKDFYLYYFLCQHPGRTLVFVNSKDCLRRLISLFTILQCSPHPLHADMRQMQRLKNLDRFANQKQAVLIASDVAARGIDIPDIDHVIHYQVPRTIENYVHRSGRTARASNLGLTVMLVGAEDARDYRKIVHSVKKGKEISLMPIDLELLPSVKTRVELARTIDVKEHRFKKKKVHNNFFQKAAEEMDMILDDDNLLIDLGDEIEQSDEKQHIEATRQQLIAALKRPLGPLHMTKYPTKSGRLLSKKAINLYDCDK